MPRPSKKDKKKTPDVEYNGKISKVKKTKKSEAVIEVSNTMAPKNIVLTEDQFYKFTSTITSQGLFHNLQIFINFSFWYFF